MKKSLKTKMMFIVGLLILLLITGSSLVAYNQAKNILKEAIFFSAGENARQTARTVSTWLEGIKNEIEGFSRMDELKSMDWELQKNSLKEIAEKHLHIETLFVADINGNFNITEGEAGNISDRDYFQQVMSTGEFVFSKPLINKATQKQVIVAAAPIYRDNNIVGVLGGTIELSYLQGIVKEMKLVGHGYGWIIDQDMQTIAHPLDEYLGNDKILRDGNQQLRDLAKKMAGGEAGVNEYSLNGINKLLAYAPVEITGWSVGIGANIDDVLNPLALIRRGSLFTGVGAIVLGLIVAFIIANYIASPIVKMSQVASIVAEGDLTQKINIKSKDEIGNLANSFNKMVENLRMMINKVSQAAQETSSNSQQLSASTEETAASIEEVASSAQEFSTTIEQLSENSQEMARNATNVNNLSKEGMETMEKTRLELQDVLQTSAKSRETILELDKASEEINSIVEVISSIADQTSLLALNAAIEAARAGEHGRGFAVVADEVRELAEESQKSAGNIQELIEGLKNKTEEAVRIIEENNMQIQERVKAVDNTAKMFKNIAEMIDELVSQIEEVAAAAQELSSGSEEISAATEEQSATIQQVSSSAQQLANMAQELSNLVSQFKL